MNPLPLLAAAALAATLLLPAHAGDVSKVPTAIKFAVVRANIADDKWVAAIDELKRMNEPANPDWNMLMGYSLRKARVPDYAAAERYYDAALAADPNHLATLEYSGELYLVLGNLPKAEQRLDALDKACKQTCLEYALLSKKVSDYKANGNRYVAPAN